MIQFEIDKASSLPLHIQLLDELRHKVMTGVFTPHDRLPGEWELATALDISRATIQKAWHTAEEEGLLYRVSGKGTFIADGHPHNPTRQAVGLIVPDFRGTFAVQMLSGAERVLRRQGYEIHLASTEYTIAEEDRILRQMQASGNCGAILWGTHTGEDNRLIRTIAQQMPVVLIDRPIKGVMLPCISSHNYAGGTQAVEHLLALGHTRIAFLARPHLDLLPVMERYRAYQDALRAVGQTPLPPILIGDGAELSSYNAYINADEQSLLPLVQLLRSPQRPTAIFAVNDWMAMRAMRAAQTAGLRIPDDLSLVGFDNLDVGEYLSPPLTTIAQDTELLGAEAARRLLALIEGDASRDILTLLPTRLIVRQSTKDIS